ncbi:hypothetical protein AALC17_12750 [Oscillospiraceae bacterium 38-13]
MNTEVSLLDCTLRDGAYITGGDFGEPVIRGMISKLQAAGTDVIECGWLKNDPCPPGSVYYHTPEDLRRYLARKNPNCTYTVMIDWDRYDLTNLPLYDGTSLDAIRVVFPRGRHRQGMEVGRGIREKGYRVFFQAANTMAYSGEELEELAEAVNGGEAECLSIVDTFGAMYPEDLERIVHALHRLLKPEVKLGFHSHNNQQLSFALTIRFIQLLRDTGRKIVVDASLCGMGRGAGNATTELVTSYLNRKCQCHYDMDAVMDAIDIYMEYFKENYHWGYSTPNFIAGLYGCHVNNIGYLLKNHRTSARDMRNVIAALPAEDRTKYDYDLLERVYLQNQSLQVDDGAAVARLRKALRGRTVFLITPGKSAQRERERIQARIREEDPVVMGVNAILPGYAYDALFFVNAARYEYARDAYPRQFRETRHILLSSVKNRPEGDEVILGFHRVIKRGWEYYDNAAICALRLMELLEVKRVVVAGFDHFQARYNESYADSFLPSPNPAENRWAELNGEIAEMLADFRRNAVYSRDIEFITPSGFGS